MNYGKVLEGDKTECRSFTGDILCLYPPSLETYRKLCSAKESKESD